MEIYAFKNKITGDIDLMFALSKIAHILTNHNGIKSGHILSNHV